MATKHQLGLKNIERPVKPVLWLRPVVQGLHGVERTPASNGARRKVEECTGNRF